jgi:hypothetical protein
MRHIERQGFRRAVPVPRLLHAGVVALLAIAALAAPLALASNQHASPGWCQLAPAPAA